MVHETQAPCFSHSHINSAIRDSPYAVVDDPGVGVNDCFHDVRPASR